MASKTDFVAKAGLIMSKDRPDLWSTPADAIKDLEYWMSLVEENYGSCGSGGYIITKTQGTGEDVYNWEWELTRQILSFDESLDEEDMLFDWTEGSPLYRN